MVQSVIQHSFHAGEWAPDLNARVDLAKYKSAAALLENYFVDYRGGASSRPGTRYVIQAFSSDKPVRLIPFQASTTVGYVLEFGDFYLRFHNGGAPIVSDSINITACSTNTITVPSNIYNVGDWILINGVGGVNNINGRYFVIVAGGPIYSLQDLVGNTPTFTGYTSGGTASRVYTISTPFAAEDLALVKFTQLVDRMFLCHPNYPPQVLTIIASDNWTIAPITFGANIGIPTGISAVTNNAGAGSYGYVVTAIDINGQESPPTAVAVTSLNMTAGTTTMITVSWTAVSGAISYNVYRTPLSLSAPPPAGATLGFLLNVTGVSAADSFIGGSALNGTDFSSGPPVGQNPFQGSGVASANVTATGTYTTIPNVTLDPPSAGGGQATAQAVVMVFSGSVVGSNPGFSVGEIVPSATVAGVSVQVTSIGGGGVVTAFDIVSHGGMTGAGATVPANPIGFGLVFGHKFTANLSWGVGAINIIAPGSGYTSVPNIVFSGGAAAATAVLESSTSGNPSVPGLHEQRLVLAAKPLSVQTFNMSQPGSYYNFNTSNPVQPSDAIEASIVSGQLNAIKSMASVPTGLVLLTSQSNWLVQSSGGALSPIDITAHAHSFNGASDVPPIIANFDILFVQNKNSIVRDLTFNFYTQIYTGTDISVLSSHLFFGYQVLEWAWAEEPFKVVWAIRNDGIALSLTFLKEQELIGWAHSVTDGLFKSVAVVTEPTELFNGIGLADATYFVVQRTINGGTVQYIERLNSRLFTGLSDVWTVDAGLRYTGAPATSFIGAEHLGGRTVTGLADGNVITPFVMPGNGTFTLSTPASNVLIGLPFTPKLQTLPLDIGEPTIQGKRKGINGVTVRVKDTLGLTIGKNFDGAQVPMKDLIIGNVGSASNVVVDGLVTGDARTIIDPSWDVPGQYCISQPNPLPSTILGVIPEIAIGDTK